jgi:diguanylate cyclase (GGDEF)-like protein/PAS domain S-box-containing protein
VRLRSAADHRHWATIAYQLAVVAPTACFLAWDLVNHRARLDSSILVWTLGVAAVDLIPVPAAGGLSLSLSFPILLAVAMIYPPPVAGLIALVGSLDPREIRRTISVLKALFVRAQIALAVLAGSTVFHALASLRSPWAVLVPAVFAMILADSVINTGLVAVYQQLSSRIPIHRVLHQMHLGSRWTFLTSYMLLGLSGVLIARFYLEEGSWAALALVAPLVFARQMFMSGRALHVTTSRYRSLTENIPAVTYIRSIEERRVVYVSPQVESLLGFTQDQWLEDPLLWANRLDPGDRERVLSASAHADAALTPFSEEYQLVTRSGRPVWVHHKAEVLRDEHGDPSFWQGVVMDISRLKAAEEQVTFMAYHDRLTGLPNRNLFEELLDQALHRARRGGLGVAVLFIDIDNFKLVNDSLGHAAGDELLRELAARLQVAVRESDVVARQGGDEFLVLITDIDLQGSALTAIHTTEAVALRIQEHLNEPFALEKEEFYVTGTIGISIFPLDARKGEDLLRNADDAMYRSKKQGPGGSLVHSATTPNLLAELSFATRIRRAVDARQWVLHYQPIVDLENGDVRAVEALIRWADPERGLIQPSEFLPLAEAMGLSEAIGDWVLHEVIRQARTWRDQGLRFEVCFNVSPRQLRRPDIAKNMLSAIEAAGLDPSGLVVEVTEAAAAGELEEAEAVLRQLRDHGLGVAMDDFGTGNSSLARLRELPVDRLKIDQMFVRDVLRDGPGRGMVSAIIKLARTIGMCPIAEGIETEEQRTFLVREGCPLGQGFYFSRPLPAEDLPHRLPRLPAPLPTTR